MPGSVSRWRGWAGSSSSLRRRFFMYWRRYSLLVLAGGSPYLLQELALADDLAGVPGQRVEQLPFGGREVHPGDVPVGDVNRVPADADRGCNLRAVQAA